jgi:hypothetical protein
MVAFEIYQDTVEFMATGPKPEQIVSFKPSDKIQERVRELVFKEKEGVITSEEEKRKMRFTCSLPLKNAAATTRQLLFG